MLWAFLLLLVFGVVKLTFLQAPKAARAAIVVIKDGQSTAQVAQKLARVGIITNVYTFRAYAVLTQTETNLQPGKYRLKSDMTYDDILDKLTEKKVDPPIKVMIPEGFTVTEIAETLAKKTDRPVIDYLEYMRGQGVSQIRPDQMPLELKTIEGYLFPKTYLFHKKDHPKKIIARMIEQFELEVTNVDWAYAKERDLSVHQILTIASLVEKEAKVPEERAIMAAVIYNRIAKGMPLQIDATVQYALPQRKDALSEQDLRFASPYNTYQQTGLPPGPISNPGIDSIKAALEPAQVDFLYYVLTSPDGSHTFTSSYNEFLQAKKGAGL